jgi:hypothetical protein
VRLREMMKPTIHELGQACATGDEYAKAAALLYSLIAAIVRVAPSAREEA